MLSRAAASLPARAGVALIGVTGMLALASCGASGDAATATGAPAPEGGDAAATRGAGDSGGAYADGTFTAEGSYATPESVETIEVTLTLEDAVITAVEVVGDPQRPESEHYQGRFIGGISDEVVGRSIEEISVDRVAGSSLTSGGFRQALERIKAEASAAS